MRSSCSMRRLSTAVHRNKFEDGVLLLRSTSDYAVDREIKHPLGYNEREISSS